MLAQEHDEAAEEQRGEQKAGAKVSGAAHIELEFSHEWEGAVSFLSLYSWHT